MIEFHEVRVFGQVPEIGEPTPVLINPAHITSVRPAERVWSSKLRSIGTEIEYIGDAGYHTRKSFVEELYAEVKAKLTETP